METFVDPRRGGALDWHCGDGVTGAARGGVPSYRSRTGGGFAEFATRSSRDGDRRDLVVVALIGGVTAPLIAATAGAAGRAAHADGTEPGRHPGLWDNTGQSVAEGLREEQQF